MGMNGAPGVTAGGAGAHPLANCGVCECEERPDVHSN